ncbi:MAG TPA: hypothetical protein VIX19_02520 [Terriglobales bacterium]
MGSLQLVYELVDPVDERRSTAGARPWNGIKVNPPARPDSQTDPGGRGRASELGTSKSMYTNGLIKNNGGVTGSWPERSFTGGIEGFRGGRQSRSRFLAPILALCFCGSLARGGLGPPAAALEAPAGGGVPDPAAEPATTPPAGLSSPGVQSGRQSRLGRPLFLPHYRVFYDASARPPFLLIRERIAAAPQTVTVTPRGIDEVSRGVFDSVNNAIRVDATLNPGGTHTPTNADQVFTSVFDSVDSAIRVNCVAGCGGGSVTFGTDISAIDATHQKVIGFNSIPVSTTAPANGQVYQYNSTQNQWAPANMTSFSAAGDLSGTGSSQKVIGLQGLPISSTPPAPGQCLSYSNSQWTPGACGTGAPGGVNAAVQFNSTGAFGGDATNFSYDPVGHNLVVANKVTAANFVTTGPGAGYTQWTSGTFTGATGTVTCGANATTQFACSDNNGNVTPMAMIAGDLGGAQGTEQVYGLHLVNEGQLGNQALTTTVPNDGTTGTAQNLLAKISSAGAALKAATTDTGVPVYVVVSPTAVGGNARLAVGGQSTCTFDAALTSTNLGHYVQASTTTAGDCHDAGAAFPSSGWTLGQITAANGTSGSVQLLQGELPGGGVGGGGSGTVTSVGLTAPTGFSVTGSPLTSSGTLGLAMPSGWTTGDLLLGNGANSVGRLGIGTSGQCLTSSGSTAAWGACGGGSATTFQVNAANTTSQSPVNFEASSPINVTNPSSGNVQYACPTCTTSSASLTSTAPLIGAGSQGVTTATNTVVLATHGNDVLPATPAANTVYLLTDTGGNYTEDAAVAVSNAGVTIMCQTKGVVIQRTGTTDLFDIAGNSFKLTGCTIDGNTQSAAGTGPLVTIGTSSAQVSDAIIDDNFFQNTGVSQTANTGTIFVPNAIHTQITRNVFQGSQLDRCVAAAGTVSGEKIQDLIIRENQAASFAPTTAIACFFVYDNQSTSTAFWTGIQIVSNTVKPAAVNAVGCYVASGDIAPASVASRDAQLIGNKCIAAAAFLSCYKLFGTGAHAVVSGNLADDQGNANGSPLFWFGDAYYDTITGNTVRQLSSTGAAQLEIVDGSKDVISSNTFQGCSTSGGVGQCILLTNQSADIRDIVVSNNTFELLATKTGTGIYVLCSNFAFNCQNINIASNHFVGDGTAKQSAIVIQNKNTNTGSGTACSGSVICRFGGINLLGNTVDNVVGGAACSITGTNCGGLATVTTVASSTSSTNYTITGVTIEGGSITAPTASFTGIVVNTGTQTGATPGTSTINGVKIRNADFLNNNASSIFVTTAPGDAHGTINNTQVNNITWQGTAPTTQYSFGGTNERIFSHVVTGSGNLASASPSTLAVTLSGQDVFSSATSYFCSVNNQTSTTDGLKVTYSSGTSFTVTGPNTVTDTVQYVCQGY